MQARREMEEKEEGVRLGSVPHYATTRSATHPVVDRLQLQATAQKTTIFILPSRKRSIMGLLPSSLKRSTLASGRSTSDRFLLSRCDTSRMRCDRCVRCRASEVAAGESAG